MIELTFAERMNLGSSLPQSSNYIEGLLLLEVHLAVDPTPKEMEAAELLPFSARTKKGERELRARLGAALQGGRS